MKKIVVVATCMVLFGALCGPASMATASEEKEGAARTATAEAGKEQGVVQVMLRVPATSPVFARFPIAVVNDDPILLKELKDVLVLSHQGAVAPTDHTVKMEYQKPLDKIINARLIIQEALRIGFDEQPEYKSQMEMTERQYLTGLLMDDITKDVKADPAKVEKLFRDKVVEWKIQSVVFNKEQDATAFAAAVKGGKSFDELAEQAVAAKTATSDDKGMSASPKKLLPPIAAAGAGLEVGGVSPVVKVTSGKETKFVVFKLMDKQWPENPQERKRAEAEALNMKQNEVLEQYRESLFKQYVTIKEKVLARLDYDAPKADFEKLKTDTRVVAEVKGGKPVTVGDLTKALADHFYHGIEQAAKEKKVNREKKNILRKVINKQFIEIEAAKRGIDRSDEYKDAVREYKNALLFGMFVNKVILPDVTADRQDLLSYYNDHKAEFTYPEMVKLQGLAFTTKPQAEAALKKLQKGSEFSWVRANAEGLAEASAEGAYEGRILTRKDLPEGMRKALEKKRAGEFTLYASPDGHFHVLTMEQIIPAQPIPFDDGKVQEEIRQAVLEAKVDRAITDWGAKLRPSADIAIYISGIGR
jgi:hypothetical protein